MALTCAAMDADGVRPGPRRITLRARAFVAAAGAIGTPALLLRSRVPDPHAARRQAHVPAPGGRVGGADAGDGSRPTTARRRPSTRTTSSTRCRPTGPMGYKLEAPPMHPILAAITLPNHGGATRRWMRRAAADAGAARAAARRLPSRQPRRHASRCAATARRCSTTRSRRTSGMARDARFAVDGGNPVRRRRPARDAHPRRRRRPTRAGAQPRRRSTAFDLKPLVTPVVSAHVMGGCSARPRSAAARWSTRPGATIISRTCTSSTGRCSRPRSAPIRSCRSTASSRGSPPASPRRSPRPEADRKRRLSTPAPGPRRLGCLL